MLLLTALLVLLGVYVLCRWLVPQLVQSNATLALLWYDFLLETALDFITRTSRPQRLLQAVCINAVRGNPDSVIAAIDHFCQNQEWAMNVGDEKGAILDSVVMETSPSTVLELGTYCGYSAVRIMRLLPPATRFITLEMNPDYAAVARQVIQHAGLQDKVRGQRCVWWKESPLTSSPRWPTCLGSEPSTLFSSTTGRTATCPTSGCWRTAVSWTRARWSWPITSCVPGLQSTWTMSGPA
ncbi:catechol O-methyltransferase B-like isoform X2 [Sphaeramia orbicularis]|uniref:catechol O-methyltransferase B-like isoform X2 n=1 Tax=Sphaeramia orbicularis TaxID=375764 RepID=UPI00117F5562|nr:catechol O-methyltransferase B-like isoform X2 [Sphaeramia orbicularis]